MRHIIKLALFLLAAVAAFFVYSFTIKVADELIAYLAAGSLVGTYIGLAFAEMPTRKQQRTATAIAWCAMVIESVYGLLYVLSVQSPELFTPPLPVLFSVVLAALHGSAFSVLCFSVSMFVLGEQSIRHTEQPEDTSKQRDLAIIDAVSILVDSVQSKSVQISTPTVQHPELTAQPIDTDPTDENILYWHDIEKLSFEDLANRLNLSRSGAYARYISARNRVLKGASK